MTRFYNTQNNTKRKNQPNKTSTQQKNTNLKKQKTPETTQQE